MKTIWVALGLAALALAVFSRTLTFQFVGLDDDSYILRNDWIHAGLTPAGLGWAFTTFREANWHPLTWVSHMIDCSLFGLNPSGHHLSSVVLHAANVVVLFLALRALTTEFWPSAGVAAFFAVHPLRAESVAWVSERKDVLSALFFLLALLAYARYVRGPSVARLALVGGCFLAGLLAKPMVVSLPIILLLLDIWPLGRARSMRLLWEKAPLAVLAGLSSCMTVWAQAGSGAAANFSEIPLADRLQNALGTLGAYVLSLAWPTGLAAFYPHPSLIPGGASALTAAAWKGAAVVVALAVLAWIVRKRRPYIGVGWLWYLIMLLPVLGIFQVGMQARADRYTYLPTIGILMAVVWGARDLLTAKPRLRPAAVVLSVAGLLALACAGYAQAGIWRDTATLYEHTLAVTDGNFVAHNNLGLYYFEGGERAADRGDTRGAQAQVQSAREQLEEAVRIRPDYALARSNLAIVLERQGDWAGAEREYRAAIRISPRLSAAHCNLGNLLFERGDLAGASASFRDALRIDPADLEARKALGQALAQHGEPDAAILELRQALARAPRDAQLLNSLGILYARRGDPKAASAHFESALLADPNSAEAHNNLGLILAGGGRATEAEAHYRSALELRPDYFDARFNLALLLKRRGDAAGAREQLARAEALQPGDARVASALRGLADAKAQ